MNEPNYDEIRTRVEKRFKARQELLIHFAAFVLGNLLVWFIYIAAAGGMVLPGERGGELTGITFPWPLIVTFGWGIGIVAHAIEYYNKHAGGHERRERAIQQEIEREMAMRGLSEKPKRDHQLQLNEDGEIEEYVDDPSEVSYRGKR